MERRRASLEDTLEFCNKIRKAGGANPIDALMPATPEDPDECLIARNLNFSCVVNGSYAFGDELSWVMGIQDTSVAKEISTKLGLEYKYNGDYWEIKLPEGIGAVAEAFDDWLVIVKNVSNEFEDGEISGDFWKIVERRLEKEGLTDFTPYIDAAIVEGFKELWPTKA